MRASHFGFKPITDYTYLTRILQAAQLGFKVGDRVVYSVFETYAEYTV